MGAGRARARDRGQHIIYLLPHYRRWSDWKTRGDATTGATPPRSLAHHRGPSCPPPSTLHFSRRRDNIPHTAAPLRRIIPTPHLLDTAIKPPLRFRRYRRTPSRDGDRERGKLPRRARAQREGDGDGEAGTGTRGRPENHSYKFSYPPELLSQPSKTPRPSGSCQPWLDAAG